MPSPPRYIERARRGDGPGFSCSSTRIAITVTTSAISRVRAPGRRRKKEQWRAERDPIALHMEYLVAQDIADGAALQAIEQEIAQQMEAAVAFAIAAPYPDPARVAEDIYA